MTAMNLYIVGTILGLLYFTPTTIAYLRDHRATASIFMLNLLLGWTLIGWAAAMIWCVSPNVIGAEDA